MDEKKAKLFYALSALVPFNVFCHVDGFDEPKKLVGVHKEDSENVICTFEHDGKHLLEVYLGEVTPYLRRMDSMTDDEKYAEGRLFFDEAFDEMDTFYNQIHVDYRGLHEIGYAQDPCPGMYAQS